MKSKVLTALPAFCATYGGIALYAAVRDHHALLAIGSVAGLVVGGWVCLVGGRKILKTKPRLGTALIAGWIAAIIAAGAALSASLFWVGLNLPDWITQGDITDETKELAKVLVGAATAFAAVVFTDDLDKADGPLWPSTKTKRAYLKAFDKKFKGGTREYEAAFEEVVHADGDYPKIEGWGLTDRMKRAAAIKAAP